MYRIRFHGRGGQGMKTASRILGTAFFKEEFEVQDAPRYGAERRGAPIFAYVRADKSPINERGIIQKPDLVVVADDTLMGIPAAGVMQGVDEHCVLLINSHDSAATWRERLNTAATILVLPVEEDIADRAELPCISSRCAAAAAALSGVIQHGVLAQAIREELGHLGEEIVDKNLDHADEAFIALQSRAVRIKRSGRVSAREYRKPNLVVIPFERATISAAAIHAGATSVEVRTGLWRTMRPVIDYDNCSGCWWVCSSYCPDGDIKVVKGRPEIDYEHCKGCLVCVAQCPPHAIRAIAEHTAQSGLAS